MSLDCTKTMENKKKSIDCILIFGEVYVCFLVCKTGLGTLQACVHKHIKVGVGGRDAACMVVYQYIVSPMVDFINNNAFAMLPWMFM